MIFNFKPKTITIDCFTNRASVYKFNPIQKANNFYPAGIKDIPRNIIKPMHDSAIEIEKGTIKHCSGFNQLMNTGFIIPLWTDVAIESTQHDLKWYSELKFEGTHHAPEQLWNNFYSEWHHLKIQSPWVIKANKKIKFAWIPTTWHDDAHKHLYEMMTGVIEYYYQHTTNINLFIKKNGGIIEWKSGTPLIHLIPLSDDKVEIKTHLVDDKEFNKINPQYPNTKNGYGSYKKSKCPFGFGK